MKKSNFDKHYEEYRHNKRFAGIFWMFAIIAIVVGATFALTVTNTTTSKGIFDSLFGGKNEEKITQQSNEPIVKTDETGGQAVCEQISGYYTFAQPEYCTEWCGTFASRYCESKGGAECFSTYHTCNYRTCSFFCSWFGFNNVIRE